MGFRFRPFYSILKLLDRQSEERQFIDVDIATREGKAAVRAEVADSWTKKSLGLMGRKGLGEAEGMLFVFGREKKPKFWMRSMFFPVDIIFISSIWRVVDIVESAEPCDGLWCSSYRPGTPARYALEVKAGFVRRHGIGTGDRVEIGRIY